LHRPALELELSDKPILALPIRTANDHETKERIERKPAAPLPSVNNAAILFKSKQDCPTTTITGKMKQAHSKIDYAHQTGRVASAAANRPFHDKQPCLSPVEMPLTRRSRADLFFRQ
jgi:hypothetical protein